MLHPKPFPCEQCESIFSNLKIFDTHIGQEHLITLFNSLILKRSFTKNPSLGKMMTIRTHSITYDTQRKKVPTLNEFQFISASVILN